MAKKLPGVLTAKASAPQSVKETAKPAPAPKAAKAVAVFRKAVLGGV